MSKQNEIIQPLGLATILALGLAIAIGIISIWCITLVEGVDRHVPEKLIILYDGTPVIKKEQPNDETTYRDLDGKDVTRDKMFKSSMLESGTLAGPLDLDPPSIPFDPIVRFPLKVEDRIQSFSDNDLPTYWYFIDDGNLNGTGYFVGFDSKSKRRVGYLGTQDFCPDAPPSEDRFPMDGRKMQIINSSTRPGFYPSSQTFYEPSFYLTAQNGFGFNNKVAMISGDQLLSIDLPDRSITPLMKSADLISLTAIITPESFEVLPGNKMQKYLLVRSLDNVILFDADGKQVRKYIIPEILRQKSFDFCCLGDEKALITQQRRYPDFKGGEQLTWIDASGKIVQTKDVVLAGKEYYPIRKSDNWKSILVAPEPFASIIWSLLFGPLSYLETGLESNYAPALSRSMADEWPPLLTICVLSALLAWFCYRRQRRTALPWTWVWVGFVFLFGVPGFLGYLFHRRWPVMDKCPTCANIVPHDRESCSSCHAEFPLPEAKGIEVFA